MEKLIKNENLTLSNMTLSQMDVFWEKAKKLYRNIDK